MVRDRVQDNERIVECPDVWTATPNRVINYSGSELMIACWPGVEMLAPTTWTEWLQSGDDRARQQSILNLAAGHWDLSRWTWRDTSLLRQGPFAQDLPAWRPDPH